MQTIQMDLSQKQTKNSEFFCQFFKATLNFEHHQKKVTLMAYVFPKVRALKGVVR